MEEESQEILLRSMESYGVVIPPSVSSVRELTPISLVSICAQCLKLIDDDAASIPSSLPPDSVAERVRICTDIASAVKNLGYVGDISFHKFLYPSEEDLYKLIRFLAERISESSGTGRVADTKIIGARSELEEYDVRSTLEGSTKKADDEGDNKTSLIPKEIDVTAAADASNSRMASFSKDELTCVLNVNDLAKGQVPAIRDLFGNEETAAQIKNGHMPGLKDKIRIELDPLQNQEKVVVDEVVARTSELEHLEQELDLMTAAAEMAFNDQHSVDFYLDQLNEQLQAKRNYLLKLESEWDAVRKSLEERKRSLEESLFSNNSDAQEILLKLREVEQEEQFILSEIGKWEEEYSKLSADLEKQPKGASRKSYIQRIKEITKNSRKQDADIERILKETREVQLESNSIQERLHRTYAVADEVVFREAKKDPTGQKVYRLLTSIHEGFEQISEKTLATDRIRREVAEYEMKLATMSCRSLDVDKLQADLDVITRENEYLEQQFQDK